MNTIVRFLSKRKLSDFLTYNNQSETLIKNVELNVFSIVLTLINIVCIPLIIIGFIEALMLGQFVTAILYLLFYMPVLFITFFKKRLSHKVRIFVILFAFFIFAAHNMSVYAMSGVSIPLFLVMLMLCTVFLNIKHALVFLILSVAVMITLGILFVNEALSLNVSISHISKQTVSWITAGSVTVFLGFLIICSFGIIKYKMLKFHEQNQNNLHELKELNEKLQNDIEKRIQAEKELNLYKDNLEKIVYERTAEIKKQNEELEYLNGLFVGREFRIKELRDEVALLKSKIQK